MNQEELKKYKEGLEKEKGLLEKQVAGTPMIENMGSDIEGNEDMSEEADEAEQTVNNMAVREALKERLRAIDEALEKINKGEYDKK